MLSYFGRIDDAENDLRICLKESPDFARAHWLRSRLAPQRAGHNHVATLRKLLSRNDMTFADRAFLGFGLHKELDDLGDWESAWHALVAACAAKRATLEYSPQDTSRMFALLRSFSFPNQPQQHAENAAITPVFIVGMHRSGTSLLERMLSGHSQIAAAGELYDFPAQLRLASDCNGRGPLDYNVASRLSNVDYAAVGHGYLEATQWRRGSHRLFTDKLPSNFVNIGFIANALPQARILHMVRDPVATALSNLRELFSDACPYSYDMSEFADYYEHYRTLMRHWHAVIPGRIHDVRYEDLVTQPQATIARVLKFVGAQVEAGCSQVGQHKAAVATASSIRVHGAIDRASVGAWKRYAAHLSPLVEQFGAGEYAPGE